MPIAIEYTDHTGRTQLHPVADFVANAAKGSHPNLPDGDNALGRLVALLAEQKALTASEVYFVARGVEPSGDIDLKS